MLEELLRELPTFSIETAVILQPNYYEIEVNMKDFDKVLKRLKTRGFRYAKLDFLAQEQSTNFPQTYVINVLFLSLSKRFQELHVQKTKKNVTPKDSPKRSFSPVKPFYLRLKVTTSDPQPLFTQIEQLFTESKIDLLYFKELWGF